MASADAVRAQPTPAEITAAHVLRRVSAGPTPGQAAQVAGSLNAYIATQLQPGTIHDQDASLLALLADTLPPAGTDAWTIEDLVRRTLARRMFSKRQLQETMTAFWEEHFSTNYSALLAPLSPSVVQPLLGSPTPGMPLPVVGDEAEAAAFLEMRENERFRSLALGTFLDLLTASVEGAPMMLYLDQWVSVPPKPIENLARELMELFCMGTNAGFSEADVQEVAMAFTGWGLQWDSAELFSFRFDAIQHQDSVARILVGTGSPLRLAGKQGQAQGDAILAHLAGMPATKDFICRKLIRFFVTDEEIDPVATPALDALLTSCVAAWGPRGNISAVLNVLLTSSEFQGTQHHWSKVKDPVTHVVSTVRALGGTATHKGDLDLTVRILDNDLGQRLFRVGPPTGYPIGNSNELVSTGHAMHHVNDNQWLSLGVTSHLPAANYAGGIFFDVEAWVAGLGGIPTGATSLVDTSLEALYPGVVLTADRTAAIAFASSNDQGQPGLPLATLFSLGTPSALLAYRQRQAHTISFLASLVHSHLR